jgi:penicillin-binding protein 1B
MAKGFNIKWGKLIKKTFIVSFWVSIPLLVIFTFYLLYLTKVVSDRFNGRKWDLPSKVYSDSLVLYPEMSYPKLRLEAKLKRLEYGKTKSKSLSKGNYRIDGDTFYIYLHDFDYPRDQFHGFQIRVEFENEKIKSIKKTEGDEELLSFQLEPEMIAELFSKKMQERKILRLKDVPDWFPKMLVAVEDKRFYSHHGIDYRSIARAMVANLKNLRISQGGSTITQQLVRNLFLYQRQTLWRKFREALMAVILEVLHSKDEILETYMNEVWMGQKGSVSIHGFGEASRFYFGKDIKYIQPIEGAILTGMIKSAYVYSPYRFREKSFERARLVLQTAVDAGVISQRQYNSALGAQVEIKEYQQWENKAAYFISFIQRQLLELYPEDTLTTGGLKIFTTLDTDIQKSAQDAINVGLMELERDYKGLKKDDPLKRLQASFIVVKPQTGYIKAYIGGRDFKESQFDRISMAKRQPGSLFKPFVFLTAFELDKGEGKYTPASLLDDSELTVKYDRKTYKPRNYDDKYFGTVTYRTALEKSLNSATVRLGREVGEEIIVEIARKLGIESQIEPYPSLSLGSFEVTPIEMVQAYAVIANMGTKASLMSLKDVVDKDGEVLEKKTMQLERITSPQGAYLIDNILTGVFERGTAKAAREFWHYTGKGAGKTGTTDDYRDSWFVGYTPELLSVSWVGFDSSESTKLTGAGGGLRIWVKFMNNFPKEEYDAEFPVPENITFENIDLSTGKLPGRGCENVVKEAFVEGTEPKERVDCK